MKNIIFIAPPAAGKGTISSMICSKYNIPHISTGDLLRNEIASLSKIGQEIKEGIQGGNLTLILYWSELAENFNITHNIKNLSH